MLFSQKMDIKEVIISELSAGSLNSLDLNKKVLLRKDISKQGFYKALRELISEEIVTKNKQNVLLSPIWVNKLQGFINTIQQSSHRQVSSEVVSLAEGDTMIFRFKSVIDLYLLWNHYFFIFCKQTEGSVIFFNSHNFWVLIRSDIENEMYRWIRDTKKEAYSVIGHNTPLDRSTSDYIRESYNINLSYDTKPLIRDTIFPAIFGDYIMSTIIDQKTVDAIHQVYLKYKAWEPVVELEMKEIIKKMGKSKVVIERNAKKAEKLRKKLMNHFIFYKK
jgi:hypothetical protein